MESSEVIIGTTAERVRIDRALADASGLSRARIQALIGEGRVTLGGSALSDPALKPAPGTQFAIHIPPPDDPQARPQDIPIEVIFEDAHLLVVDKPAGMVVHPAAGNPDGTLVNALLHHCATSGMGTLSGIGGVARPGIVHRIDKDTSGLLVVAKSDAAHEGLAAQFAAHSLERAYLAVVAGQPVPPAGTIDARIGRSDANRKKMAVLEPDRRRGKHAVTHYRTLSRFEGASLVECRLETGRTHQVRVHCASIGHALLGDPVYGRTPERFRKLLAELGFARQALHAATLGFVHPVNRDELRFTSDLPADMRELIERISGSD